MKSFLKSLCAAVLGNLIVAAIVICFSFVMLIAFIAVALSGSGKNVVVPDKAFLVLDLAMSVNDTPARDDPGVLAVLANESTPRMGLWDLTEALAAAAKDKRVRGLLITGSLESANYGSGHAALAELRRAVLDFGKSGKPVHAYLESPSLKDYYVASAAGTIWLNPFGELGLRGLASQNIYIGNALAKYGVGMQVVKVGKYKSAIESLTSDKMSDADRQQRTELLQAQWNRIVADIAASRKIAPEQVRRAADRGILDATAAVQESLADRAAYLDELIARLKELGGKSADGDTFAQIAIRDYVRNTQASVPRKAGPAVAIVYAEGDITDGNVHKDVVCGRELAATLRRVAADKSIRAVVLRVNSPGGSAFASEVIQREMRRLSESDKPIVVSMGTYAASGGYWISAYARKIFAEESTITGSIGVFGIVPNVREFAASWGVTFDGVKTSPHADLQSVARPKTPEEIALLQRHTDKIYDAFLDKVAEGRRLKREDVAAIAEGRVWAGVDAKKVGLVDDIGGLRDAVRYAAKSAGLDEKAPVRQFPERRTSLEEILQLFSDADKEPPIARATAAIRGNDAPLRGRNIAARTLRPIAATLRILQNMDDPAGIHARLPFWEAE